MSTPSGLRRSRLAREPGLNPLLLAIVVSAWLATAGNWPLWRALVALPEMGTTRGLLFIAGSGLAIAAVLMALLSLFAWRGLIKPVASVLLLAAAAGAHFMGSYGIVIDPTMVVNVLATNEQELRELLGARWLVGMLWLAGAPLWLLWRTPVAGSAWRTQAWRNALSVIAASWLAGGLLVIGFADLSSTLRNHKSLRYMINPLNSIVALVQVQARGGARRVAQAPQPIGEDMHRLGDRAGSKPPLLMLVIGETARADHFSLNGYRRPTNAATAPLGVISFGAVASCGTSTAASLPCMFSHLGRERFMDRAHEFENLLDVLQRAGLAVLWLDNQAGCKGLCARVPHAFAHDPPPGVAMPAGLCDGEDCLDAALLVGLEQRLAALPEARRERGVVLVLHQMGSHGPAYGKRSPPDLKPFRPECTRTALQTCSRDELINAYDNSIAYTDSVLADAIGWLSAHSARYAPMLLYVSDHGESLGENNFYLHGMPLAIAPREQTQVPMLLWLPTLSEPAAGATAGCIAERRDAPYSHDNLFHTVLGLLDVGGSLYRPELDLAAPCRGSGAEARAWQP